MSSVDRSAPSIAASSRTSCGGYQPQQHVQAFNQLKGDVAILNSFGSATTKAIQPQFQREKLVTVPASFDSIWGTDPTVAPVGTPYSIDVANALDYVTDGGAKRLKVGIIYQNDEYGADGLRGFEAAQAALGFTDAGRQAYKPGDTDFTAQVQKLNAAGADAVVVTALPSATGPIVGTAATLGFAPQWILQGPSYIEQLITEDGTVGGKPTPIAAALKGAIVTSFSAPWGHEGATGMEQLIADQKEFAPDQTPSIYFALAYSQGKVVEQILRKAIDAGDLTREGILTAKENLGEIDLGGITPAVTYTPEGGPPSRQTLITEVDPKVSGFLTVLEAGHTSEAGDGIDISA
jgi:ABC-type branched-subunit amino acid transport system substrate-binding protein